MAEDGMSELGSETTAEKDHSSSSISDDEIRSELNLILESPGFKGSKRCQDFLKYVVEQALVGLPQGMKERTIGTEVFGRSPVYDTNADGIVRIKASFRRGTIFMAARSTVTYGS